MNAEFWAAIVSAFAVVLVLVIGWQLVRKLL